MPALASPATWRTHPYSVQSYLFLDKPVAVFAARVNMAAASIVYPLTAITFDTVTTGAYTNIKEGQTITLGSAAGDDDYGRTVVRSSTDAVISIGWTSRGTHDGELDVVDNAYITVWDDHRVWAKVPRILDDGTHYKWGTLVYTDGNPPLPVCVIGRGMGTGGFVTGTPAVLTVSLTAANSYATATGATISSYLWAVGDGTITVGSTSTAAITATFPAGRRWISCTVTDSNTNTHARWYLVAACTTTGATAPIYNFEIEQRTLRAEGQTLSLKIHEAIAESTYPDGCAAILWERENYGGTVGGLAGPTGAEHVKFTGWHQSHQEEGEAKPYGIETGTTLEFLDVAGRLATLPGFSQVVERDASPATWLQMADADIDLYLHYLLQWHSTALDVADFTWSGLGSTYPFAALMSDGGSLYDQVDGRAQAIAHRLTCDSSGRLWVKPDPMLLDSGSRTATIIVDIDETDWTSYRYQWTRPPRTHWVWGGGVLTSSTDADTATIGAVFCVAPGQAPGQGLSSTRKGSQLVASQTELNAREGHRYAARMNAPMGMITWRLAHGGDAGIEPAHMEWVRNTISAANAAKRGLTWTDAKFLPVEVRYRYDHKDGTRVQEVSAEKEVVGLPAPTYIPPTTDYTTPTYTAPSLYYPKPSYTYTDPARFRLLANMSKMAGFDSAGYHYKTTSFDNPSTSGGPNWVQTSLGLAGTPYQFVVDAFSYLTSSIDGWLFCSNGIYKVTDIHGAPSATLQYTWPITFTQYDNLNADASFAVSGWALCTVSDANGGTNCAYTTDGGTNWNWVQITSYNETNNSYNHTPFCYVSSNTNGFAIASAFTSTASCTAVPSAFETNDYGATWAAYDGPITFELKHGLGDAIEVPFNDNAGETVAFYGYRNITDCGGGKQTIKTYRSEGGTRYDITPIVGGLYYKPFGRWRIKTAPTNRHKVLLCAYGEKPDATAYGYRAVFTSDDDGDTWSTIVAPVSGINTYTYGAISGDDADMIYLWGGQGRVGVSFDFGATIDDRRGNISGMSGMGEMIGLCGG
jgi:hypothetical protein